MKKISGQQVERSSLKSFFKSFRFASRGIAAVIRQERNFRIHTAAMILVIAAGFYVGLSACEWCLIVLTIGMVLTMEIFNTAAERIVDFLSPEFNTRAGEIKDIAAGGVLITSIAALVTGLIIFIPKII